MTAPEVAEIEEAKGPVPEASMRPGHDCPGSTMMPVCVPVKENASMRPGHDCPGSRGLHLDFSHQIVGFNEAGA